MTSEIRFASATRVAPQRLWYLALVLFAVPLVAIGRWSLLLHLVPSIVTVVGVLAALVSFFPSRRSGVLRVDDTALVWNSQLLFRRAELRDAIAYSNGPRHGARVRGRFRTEYFELSTRADAERLVAALGLEAGRATVGTTNRLAPAIAFTWFPLVNLLRDASPFALAGVAFAIVCILLMLFGSLQRITVGSDGVRARNAFRGHFVPYREIARIDVVHRVSLKITRTDGSNVVLGVGGDDVAMPRPAVGVHAIATRITEERARQSEASDAIDLAPVLARGKRSAKDWLAALRAVGDEHATFRDAAVTRDQLWRVVENGAGDVEVRAAAATALRTSLDERDRQRLRVAAATCAAPKLRVAIEAATDGDDELLARTLERVG